MPLRPTALALLIAFLGAASAHAGVPPGDEPPGGDDGHRNHVYRLKPWKPRFEYRMIRDARVYSELNSRSDKVAEVLKGQWWQIDCQLVATTQNGQILWDHIPNVGWIADKNIRTYSDG